MRPKAAGNGYGCHVRVPGMTRVFRYDAALFARLVSRRIRGVGRLLLQDPSDGRLAEVDTCPGQRVGDLHLSERRTENLDLLDRVADKIRKPIDRPMGVDQRLIVGSPEPCPDGVVGYQEVTRRLRLF